ncbi:BolA family transcriptional regulator [Phyllobacterium sp. 21LDTY02-6]|jgi:BolA family transcriptional regulator, general stress-responsive regulator|uniref:BolA family protein n=1 Tax=unclassified Phyllobacterium TaxID=2638441 RepID=UPI00202099B0|nr:MULTISPECIES: BolA family protein [unclassified Phyllobacterium]MCO4317741.1 BolA family transcriptional regulator [Phyllobacterium sp. 21LDTY02-6]MCX8281532.1 BolA family transcriptional regulator [Phyllobacterium sp. 0TCS1.6C]MCX8292872.1 BolA family transcriptional regulator [Phyllobacterium sp. 0TCS1.6A]
MSTQSAIENKLTKAFHPISLAVINESHLHAGHHHSDGEHHATFDGSGETHFRVRIVAEAFSGMSRVERHRSINKVLEDELKGTVHALALEPSAPDEAARR